MTKNWVAVASAEHVQYGQAHGFMQVCHGKAAPLRRITPGDRVVYYSSAARFREAPNLQAFTAIGVVKPGTPYQADMGNGFHPYRRDVDWYTAQQAPIRPLLELLDFTAGKQNHWGYPLRLGLFPISEHDMILIAQAMHVALTTSSSSSALHFETQKPCIT